MQKHLSRMIEEFELIPKALVKVVAAYFLYLMLETRGHDAKQAASLMGVSESSFSRMLNGDCRSSCFRAFEAHVNFCLAAYNLQRCNESAIPKSGTSLTEYTGLRKLQDGVRILNQFNGVQRFKKATNEALAEMATRKVA